MQGILSKCRHVSIQMAWRKHKNWVYAILGATRFELAASWSRTKRPTKLGHAPDVIFNYTYIFYGVNIIIDIRLNIIIR